MVTSVAPPWPKYTVAQQLCPKPVLILSLPWISSTPVMRRRDGRCLFNPISVSQKWLSALGVCQGYGSGSWVRFLLPIARVCILRQSRPSALFFFEPEGERPGIVRPGIVRLVDCTPMLPCLAWLTQHRLFRYRNLDFTAWT